jgi:hypothetical protein
VDRLLTTTTTILATIIILVTQTTMGTITTSTITLVVETIALMEMYVSLVVNLGITRILVQQKIMANPTL